MQQRRPAAELRAVRIEYFFARPSWEHRQQLCPSASSRYSDCGVPRLAARHHIRQPVRSQLRRSCESSTAIPSVFATAGAGSRTVLRHADEDHSSAGGALNVVVFPHVVFAWRCPALHAQALGTAGVDQYAGTTVIVDDPTTIDALLTPG